LVSGVVDADLIGEFFQVRRLSWLYFLTIQSIEQGLIDFKRDADMKFRAIRQRAGVRGIERLGRKPGIDSYKTKGRRSTTASEWKMPYLNLCNGT
jgi:hypothetical protein